MIETLLKGILIGIIVSAPMGPVGMLCVRRTMMHGRKQGLLTGLGAAISDILYASLTLLGAGAFIDLIRGHKEALQLFGNLFIIMFGIYIMISSSNLHGPKEEASQHHPPKRPWKAFASAFGLTASNVLIVILYIGLFTQLSFVSESGDIIDVLIGLLGIGIGAICWWFTITGIIVKVRDRFTPSSMKMFNKILGIILVSIGMISLAIQVQKFL